MINLITDVARQNFKKFGEEINDLWIMRFNSTIRANLTFFWIIRFVLIFKLFIIKFSVLQMLHGCRTDLIFKCLVYFNKDRNFYLFLQKNFKFLKLNKNNFLIDFWKKITSKSLWLLYLGLSVWYIEKYKKSRVFEKNKLISKIFPGSDYIFKLKYMKSE